VVTRRSAPPSEGAAFVGRGHSSTPNRSARRLQLVAPLEDPTVLPPVPYDQMSAIAMSRRDGSLNFCTDVSPVRTDSSHSRLAAPRIRRSRYHRYLA